MPDQIPNDQHSYHLRHRRDKGGRPYIHQLFKAKLEPEGKQQEDDSHLRPEINVFYIDNRRKDMDIRSGQ